MAALAGGDLGDERDAAEEYGNTLVATFGEDPVGGHEDESSYGWVRLDDFDDDDDGSEASMFRMPRLCNMSWRDGGQRGPGSFEDCIVRIAPFSGPIAVAPRPSSGGAGAGLRLGRVRADSELVPRIYDPDGVKIGACDRPGNAYGSVSIEERGALVDMGWDGSERLICVWQQGIVTIHAPLGGREVACVRLPAVREQKRGGSSAGGFGGGTEPVVFKAAVGSLSVAVVVQSQKQVQRPRPRRPGDDPAIDPGVETAIVDDFSVWCIPDVFADELAFRQAKSTGLPQGVEPMCMAILQPILPEAAKSWMRAAATRAREQGDDGDDGEAGAASGAGASGKSARRGRKGGRAAGVESKAGEDDEDGAGAVFPVVVLGASGRKPLLAAIDSNGVGTDLNAAGAALDPVSPAIMICPSPSAQYVAIVTGGGHLRICGASLEQCYLDCELQCPISPDHLAWCTEDAVVVSWPPPPDLSVIASDSDQAGALLVGNTGACLRVPLPGGGLMACALGTDVDSVRIVGQRQTFRLEPVPLTLSQTLLAGSLQPCALLLAASQDAEKGKAEAEKQVRSLRQQGQLRTAVFQLIEAAQDAGTPGLCRKLLGSAAWGISVARPTAEDTGIVGLNAGQRGGGPGGEPASGAGDGGADGQEGSEDRALSEDGMDGEGGPVTGAVELPQMALSAALAAAARRMRVLFALRGVVDSVAGNHGAEADHRCVFPLTSSQWQALGPDAVVDRLSGRGSFRKALQVADQFRQLDGGQRQAAGGDTRGRVIAEWAAALVANRRTDGGGGASGGRGGSSASPASIEASILFSLAKAVQPDALGPIQSWQELLGNEAALARAARVASQRVNVGDLAALAYHEGNTELAGRLLAREPQAERRVPLLLRMGLGKRALEAAIEAGETNPGSRSDLLVTALLALRELIVDKRVLAAAEAEGRQAYEAFRAAHAGDDPSRGGLTSQEIEDRALEAAFFALVASHRSAIPVLASALRRRDSTLLRRLLAFLRKPLDLAEVQLQSAQACSARTGRAMLLSGARGTLAAAADGRIAEAGGAVGARGETGGSNAAKIPVSASDKVFLQVMAQQAKSASDLLRMQQQAEEGLKLSRGSLRGQSGYETIVSLLCISLNGKARGSDLAGPAARMADEIREALGVDKYSSRWWRATMEAAAKAMPEVDGPGEIFALCNAVRYAPPGIRWDEPARQCLACQRDGSEAAVKIADRLSSNSPYRALVLLDCGVKYVPAGAQAALDAHMADGGGDPKATFEALRIASNLLRGHPSYRELAAQVHAALTGQ